MSFSHTRAALAKAMNHSTRTAEQRLKVRLAVALNEMVKALEQRLNELDRKLDALARRR